MKQKFKESIFKALAKEIAPMMPRYKNGYEFVKACGNGGFLAYFDAADFEDEFEMGEMIDEILKYL